MLNFFSDNEGSVSKFYSLDENILRQAASTTTSGFTGTAATGTESSMTVFQPSGRRRAEAIAATRVVVPGAREEDREEG